jgi:hypothetical protein
MDPIYIIDYWSRQLGINKAQFIKPYIKESNRLNINQKGYGHGTCGIYVYNRRLKEKIIFGIDAIAESVTGEKPENLL